VTYAYASRKGVHVNKTLFFDCNKLVFNPEMFDRGEYNLPDIISQTADFLTQKIERIDYWI
jgi:hypothetical protein